MTTIYSKTAALRFKKAKKMENVTNIMTTGGDKVICPPLTQPNCNQQISTNTNTVQVVEEQVTTHYFELILQVWSN